MGVSTLTCVVSSAEDAVIRAAVQIANTMTIDFNCILPFDLVGVAIPD